MDIYTQEQAILSQINHLLHQKSYSQALSVADHLISQKPKFTQAWLAKAFIYHQMGQSQAAEIAINKALELEPDNTRLIFQKMMLLDGSNRPEDSLEMAQSLVEKSLPDASMYPQLAHILYKHEDFTNALTLYQKLTELDPGNAGWHLKQAMLMLNLGNINDSKSLVNKALAIQPAHPDVLFFRSHLEKQNQNFNHINELKHLIKHAHSDVNQAKLYFSLAKELEDCAAYQESIEARLEGCRLFRNSFQYDVESDIQFMKEIRQQYSQEFVHQSNMGYQSNEPIFIVGLPRSGTTLLDRIITSHNDVFAAGELRQLNHCIIHHLKELNLNPDSPRSQMVESSIQIDFNQLGEDYIRTSRTRTGQRPRFTDKFPQNSYYVGMILKALPKAKVIIMQRHPVSVCYSVMKQLFTNDSYHFSYDLQEMAKYYIEHNNLLNHWQQIGGNQVMTVHYEDLVTDLEQQAKTVLQFLNLDWQPQCIDFHKNKQQTATASASQVRQKLYTGSIDLWKNYQPQLQPLIDTLKQAGINI